MTEQEKYIYAYTLPNYRMGDARKSDAFKDLNFILKTYSDIATTADISAGRGEVVKFLQSHNVYSIGTEFVPTLANKEILLASTTNLPFKSKSFDLVTNCDAMEHYPPEDTHLCLQELFRISKKYNYFTINNNSSTISYQNKIVDLHINKRPFEEWLSYLSEYGEVITFKNKKFPSLSVLVIHE